MFTDTHSHIHFANDFPDVEEILVRAKQARVSRQIIVGCTVKDSFEALEFVRAREGLWSTLGVHPHNANEWNDEVRDRFQKAVEAEGKIVAIGEIGMDYFRNLQPHELQASAFEEQLILAKKLDLPVVVHVRDACDDALKILAEVGNFRVILHCFTGTMEHAKICWERGYYISFSGVLTYPKNDYLREVASVAPAEQILIETDCPFLTPQVVRGKRNEPAYVVETAKVLAASRGVSLEEIGLQTTKNAVKIFGID